MRRLAGSLGWRDIALVVAGLAIGLTVAYFDSRPTWDDTGITVAVLLLTAGMLAGLSGRRPWLWAVLVGAWTPLLEIPLDGEWLSILALAAAGIGAALGYWVVSSARRPG
ncbi:MAG: hypothetical protein WD116_02625 [Chloroflexota bacterium]